MAEIIKPPSIDSSAKKVAVPSIADLSNLLFQASLLPSTEAHPTESKFRQRVQEDAKYLKEQIQDLKIRNYKFQIVPGAIGSIENDPFQASSKTTPSLTIPDRFQSGTATDLIHYNYFFDQQVPPNLSISGGVIPIVPFAIYSNKEGRNVRVIVADAVLGDAKPVINLLLPLDRNGELAEEQINKLSVLINKELELRSERHKFEVESVAPKSSAPITFVAEYSKTEKLDSNSSKSLTNLLNEYAIGFEPITGNTQSIDRFLFPKEGQAVMEKDRYGIRLDLSKLQQSGFPTIDVEGQVNRLILRKEFQVSKERYDEMDDSLPKPEYWKDKFGNQFVKVVTTVDDKPLTVQEYVFVLPPYALAESVASKNPVQLSIDFSGIGHGIVERILSRKESAPVQTIDGYKIYTHMNPELITPRMWKNLSLFISGVKESEEFFGWKPRTVVRNIFIGDSALPNATSERATPGLLVVFDELLKGSSKPLKMLGQHEETHQEDFVSPAGITQKPIFDFYYKQMQTFIPLMEDIVEAKRHLLFKLSEENFYGSKNFGHPFSNAFEITASVLDGIRSPQWEAVVAKMSSQHRDEYKNLLRENLNILQSDSSRPVNSKAVKLLTKRIEQLEKLK